MKFLITLFIILLFPIAGISQIKNIFQKEIDSARFEPSVVIDQDYGIVWYDIFVTALKGDSIRNCAGYSCQGFKEDFYTNGDLLHKGYYENGKLTFFKNYYPGGKMEREYKVTDLYKGRLITYWPAGNVRSDGLYQEGITLKYSEYFEDGQLFHTETMNKTLDYYTESKTFFSNGFPSATLIMINPKKLEFEKSEYHENGMLREKGKLVYSKEAMEYHKFGKWEIYNESGKLIRESEFSGGNLISEKEL